MQIEGDLRADIHAVLHALFAYMRSVQAAVDDNLPSPLPHYDFRRDVLGRMADLPAPDDTEEQLLSSLVFLMRSPRQPQDDALALDHETADGVRGQAVVCCSRTSRRTACCGCGMPSSRSWSHRRRQRPRPCGWAFTPASTRGCA